MRNSIVWRSSLRLDHILQHPCYCTLAVLEDHCAFLSILVRQMTCTAVAWPAQ